MNHEFWIFENEINEEVPWKLDSRVYGMKKHKFPEVSIVPSFSMGNMKSWHFSLIVRALTGRLKNEDDALMAKKFGYVLMGRRAKVGKNLDNHNQNLLNIAEEELEDLADSYNELVDRMKKDLMGEEE